MTAEAAGVAGGPGRGERWPPALASLAVGAAFFGLWFWLLPSWLGFHVDVTGDCGGAALRRIKWMGRRDDAHVRAEYHIVRDVEPAKAIESTVLVYEGIMPAADFVPAGGIERRDQQIRSPANDS